MVQSRGKRRRRNDRIIEGQIQMRMKVRAGSVHILVAVLLNGSEDSKCYDPEG